MKTIVLMVSKVFPAYHPRKGDYTDFKNLILAGVKLHTVRGNYDLWKKRIEQVKNGEAKLSLRRWSGTPYKSKQEEFANFINDKEIGVQKLDFAALTIGDCTIDHSVSMPIADGAFVPPDLLAKNDGLHLEDFFSWFQSYDLSKPMAIIQFTGFRY